ncbi:hypothetical protein MJO28_016423 [Puccinia striiformis f. sp. tritici]|uniref:Uncharacterized protein n=1 Tax=Puccinia striiformis f. sp. tritici TaxID=168172 RepID=A0ACC0DNB4_9BASI|nr:hypothetical protein MJO28_016423 [Puccinia striiformis f. sp. tritici]
MKCPRVGENAPARSRPQAHRVPRQIRSVTAPDWLLDATASCCLIRRFAQAPRVGAITHLVLSEALVKLGL